MRGRPDPLIFAFLLVCLAVLSAAASGPEAAEHRVRGPASLEEAIAGRGDLGMDSDGDDGRYCSATARAVRKSCRFDALADFWVAVGTCRNVIDEDERAECIDGADEGLVEAREECSEQYGARLEDCDLLGQGRYDPDFDPARFVDPDEIGGAVAPNPYLPLVAGTRWVYESEAETTTVEVLDETKLIEGVTCRVVRDIVEADGFPVEVTDDWLAQDIEGNVWYCGESVRDFEMFEGDVPPVAELVSIDGSFKAGRDGARPGILMPAHPAVGDAYREEAALGEAEDIAEVIDVTASEAVPAASCEGDCVVTRNTQPLEPGVVELKFYAPGVGMILETDADGGRVELVAFTAP